MVGKKTVWIIRAKQDFIASLEPRFCGCFCGRGGSLFTP